MKKITIYTDGACSGNPGPGGWGAVLIYNDHEKQINGQDAQTTNNRMELMAVIGALNTLKEACVIDLYTDSKYVMQGVNDWLAKWKNNGWKTASKKPVKNQDLWQELDLAITSHDITWHWVKGHSGDHYNEMADRLAREAISALD